MLKNINSITIIITLKDIEEINTEKMTAKHSEDFSIDNPDIFAARTMNPLEESNSIRFSLHAQGFRFEKNRETA